MIGTITRWGSRGYGFVTCEQLESEAWLHAKFLEDPGYEPRQGDRVEFDAERLPDGRYQARRVRPLDGAAHARPRVGGNAPASYPAYNDGRVAVKLSLPPLVLPSAPPSALPAGPAVALASPLAAPVRTPAPLSLVEPVEPVERARRRELSSLSPALAAVEEGPARDPIEPRVEPREARAQREPRQEQAVPPPADEPLGARLARQRTQRREEAGRLRAEVDRLAEEMARLEGERRAAAARLEAIETGSTEDERRAVAEHIEAARRELESDFTHRRLLAESHESARSQAIARSGLPTVLEYEDVRRRLAEMVARDDVLAQKAFRALERERRMTLRDLADAADRLEAAPLPRARFVVFARMPGGDASQVVLVAPLAAARLHAGGIVEAGPLGVRAAHLAYAFWQVSERANREGGAAESDPEYGEVVGAPAVRLPALDAGLLQLLLDEAWAARAPLSTLTPELELVEGVGVPWIAEPDVGAEPDAVPRNGAGAPPHAAANPLGLAEVALRLDLTARDLVALLTDRGLPFAEDVLDPGTEETLRALLGDDEPVAGTGSPREAQSGHSSSDDAEPAGETTPRLIAGRMLRKLLRDRRVGGRHTRIENAYGHHFSDGEKDVARKVAEWLEKDGILLPKLNEGSHHISINPRRLRDVGQIVDGTWDRAEAFDAL